MRAAGKKRVFAWAVWLAIIFSQAAAVQASSVVGGYLLLSGIKGGSADKAHANWIEFSTLGTIVSNRSGVKAAFPDIAVAKLVDVSSPYLAPACATGSNFASATIEFTALVGTSTNVFYRIKLENVQVSGMSASGANGGGISEGIKLKLLGRITWSYYAFGSKAGNFVNFNNYWDLIHNVGGPVPSASLVGIGNASSGNVTLTWPATNGVSYNILGSGQANGVYNTLATLTAVSTGQMSFITPATSNAFFFQLGAVP